MNTLHGLYEKKLVEKSDIHMHLHKLREIAEECQHVTEFGFRGGNSATALCMGLWGFRAEYGGDVVFETYDIVRSPEVAEVGQLAADVGVRFVFHEQSTVDEQCIILPTDFLFIDTLHTYDQVRTELRLHAMAAKKFLGFHDVTTFPELAKGIEEWWSEHPEWEQVYRSDENNGLLILENRNGE